MIPLEAARLGVKAWGIDYSPVATFAGPLLADYPLRDWNDEPALPFGGSTSIGDRLLADVELVLTESAPRCRAAWPSFTRGRRKASLGIPVGRDPAVSGVRATLSDDGFARAASSAGEEGESWPKL